MDDLIPLISVVSSASVALGGLWLTYMNGQRQREHERRLDWQGRAWSEKSDALGRAVVATKALVKGLRANDVMDREVLGLTVVRTRESLQDVAPSMESYADDTCRAAFETLLDALDRACADADPRAALLVVGAVVEEARREKLNAVEQENLEEAQKHLDRERGSLQRATNSLRHFDRAKVGWLGDRFIEAARADLRGGA